VAILIDPPLWQHRDRRWSHLVSDTSLDELHAFARSLGIPPRGFHGDHYDLPAEHFDDAVAAGAVPVTSRELLVRLRRAGLRVSPAARRAALADGTLADEIAQHTFGDDLRDLLAENLARHDRLSIDLDGRRHAAVAVVVVDSDATAHGHDLHPALPERLADIPGAEGLRLSGSVAGTAGGPAVLLTRRAATLRAHAGQWALPGGRVDEGEEPVGTALRELHEELDLELGHDAVLGLLDDYPTRSGYVITPVVVWGGADPAMRPHPDEVLSVHRVAFRELCRPDSPRFVSIPESDRPVVQLPVGGDLIHAPTGAVLVQFRWVAIEGTPRRVHEFEQPVFAWR
jgi:8-oxo-dGTP pyrophosphatase MutT (NUDIX family)